MADQTHMLDGLRAIHMPLAADAAGSVVAMMLIGGAVAVALSVVLWPVIRRWHAVRRSALAALAMSRALDPAERLAAQAVLLRRLVRTIDGDAAARLQGGAWLDCLDRLFATRFFTQGEGRSFGEALYRPLPGQDAGAHVDALDAALARLLARVPR